MNKQIKRFLACVLIVSLSIISLTPVSAAKAFSGTVAPFYNNVSNATANLNISNSGKLEINYSYVGSSSITTKAVITKNSRIQTTKPFFRDVSLIFSLDFQQNNYARNHKSLCVFPIVIMKNLSQH